MADLIDIDVPVKDVYLMEDRAKVHRHNSVHLSAGVQRLCVSGIAHAACDKTLLVKVNSEQVKIVSSSIHRERQSVDELPEEDYLVLEREHKEKTRLLNRNKRSAKYIKERLTVLSSLEEHTLREILEDVSFNKSDNQHWSANFTQIDENSKKLIEEYNVLKKTILDQAKELEDLTYKMDAQELSTFKFLFNVHIDVNVAEEGDYQFDIDYITPNACWRPCHTATLLEDGTLQMDIQGCVWQCTGEDWNSVQLHFSTQRASLGVKPPELSEDLLRVKKKEDRVVVEMREQAIQSMGLGSKATEEMPGVDDGGEVVNLSASTLSTVPSDGRSFITIIDSFETSCEESIVCMPELQLAAITKTKQSNASSIPLLAGPVDLIRNSGKVGRTSIDYISAGEVFELGWGPESNIRIQRRSTENRPKAGMLSSWEEIEKHVSILLSNMGGTDKKIILQERIPISEVEQVQIVQDFKETSGGQKPDENGFVKWDVLIKGNKTESIKLAHTIKKKKSVQEA